MKRGNRYKGLAVGCLIAVFLLVGCGRAGEGSAEGMAQSGGGGNTQPDTAAESLAGKEQGALAERQNSLSEELDALVMELTNRETLWEQADLMQDEGAKDFPEELIRRLEKALATGASDELLREQADGGLRIEREDFAYQPSAGEELPEWLEKINEMLPDPGESVAFDFYRLDLDRDGMDEILMVEQVKYEHFPGGKVVVLEQDGEGSYTLAGYDTLTYHRLYALFDYEGNYYLVCNYDDTEREVTKALGIYNLGEDDGDRPRVDWQYVCLGRSSTDCELEELWTAGAVQKLQTTMWDYVQQIGLDLMLRNRNNKRFYGEEQQLTREEMQELLAALDDTIWTPEHIGYSAQKQRWIFTLEGQQVYFALYHRNRPEQYLVGAFCHEQGGVGKLAPIAVYGILPRIGVNVESYWDFKESNTERISCHPAQDTDLAFPKNRTEVAAQLWRQVNEGVLDMGTKEEQLVPQGLVDLAKEALYMEDWSAFAGLAEPFELTDHESVLENWFSNAPERARYINRVYQYTIGEDTYLLIAEDSGGTARFMINNCYRLTADGPEYLGDQWNTCWNDYVVSYEGNFYLVDSNYNFYSKYVDTIYIHPLTAEGISEDATEVSLNPAAVYVFNRGYGSDSPVLEQIDRYVEEIQEELMKISPINDDIRVFTGCEEPVTDPVLLQRLPGDNGWYVVDCDNDGRLEYLSKHYWYPSNYTTLSLLTERYRLDEVTVELHEFWEPECPYGGYSYEPIQLWYQEFEGKIYTFQLFLTEGYNYYLSVSLFEESQVSWIASYYVTPRCEWRIATSQNYTGNG